MSVRQQHICAWEDDRRPVSLIVCLAFQLKETVFMFSRPLPHRHTTSNDMPLRLPHRARIKPAPKRINLADSQDLHLPGCHGVGQKRQRNYIVAFKHQT